MELMQLLLEEAVEADTDQLVLIRRSQSASLYFLNEGEVKRTIPFQSELAQQLFEKLQDVQSCNYHESKTGRNFYLECRFTRQEMGECLLLVLHQINKPAIVAW